MAFNLRKPPKLTAKMEAYPYQLDTIQAIHDLPYAAIFHEQGLGKTKIAIDLTLHWLEHDIVDTVFIITKKSLVQNWLDEFNIHSHITPRMLSDNRKENSIAFNSPVVAYILNYEVISSNLEIIELFLKTCRVGVILDESQKIKNPESNLTGSFFEIAGGFTRKVIMTGTPVANRPFDIWSQVKFLDDGESLGQSFAEFKSKTNLPKNQIASPDYAKTLTGIMDQIKTFTVRETKSSSGLNLPDKTIKMHLVKMEGRQQEIYDNYRNNLAHEFTIDETLIKDDAEAVLKRLLRLVQCASNPILVDDTYEALPGKFTELTNLLNSSDLSENKAIIWSCFIENVNWLTRQLKEYNPAKVHGSLAIDDRNKAIQKFKTDDSCRILIATPTSAKEGLTLTVANHTIFYDRSFSLDDYLQAQDRIHRISQTQECFVHNLIAENTIDEWVDRLLYTKYQAAQLAQGDIDKAQFQNEMNFDLSELLKETLNINTQRRIDNGALN